MRLLVVVVFGLFISQVTAQSDTNAINNFSSIFGSLKVPVRVAIDKSDNIYVTDYSKRCVVKYDSARNYLESLNIGENPTSIAISDDNLIFVGDNVNGKIYKRQINGTVSVIYSDTILPNAMVVSPDNQLYVVDSRSKRVLVMDFAGNLIRTIGDSVFLFPTGIAFDRKNNHIIVAEHGGFGDGFNLHAEIRIFSTTGDLISTFGGWGSGNGKFYRIQGLTVGRCGNIYVSDPFQGKISVFTDNGVFITKFGQWGDSLGQLNVPMDVVFDSQERVLVTSLNNSALEVFNITDSLPSSIITNSGSSSICNGSSTPVSIRFTGTAPWTFNYTINGTNLQTITQTHDNPYVLQATLAGTYNVVSLSDSLHLGSCFSKTAHVILNPSPTASLANISTPICQGEFTDIPVSFTGNAPWSYTYTFNGSNPITLNEIYSNPYYIHVNQVGTYELTEVSGDGCVGTLVPGTAVIGQGTGPIASISSGNYQICEGSAADIPVQMTGTAPWTLTYTKNGENPITYSDIYSNPFLLHVTESGSYQVISLRDAHCMGSNFNCSVEVISHSLPTSNMSTANYTICASDSVPISISFSGSAPWAFTYSTEGVNPNMVSNVNSNPYTFYAHQSGDYRVVSLSDAYCQGANFSGNTMVQVNPTPLVNLGQDTNICSGQSIVLNGGANGLFLWSDFSTNSTLTVDSGGVYSLTVTDTNGCFSTDSIQIGVIPNPVSSFIYNSSNFDVGFINTSSNASNFSWNFGDGSYSNEANPIHSYSNLGTYIVMLISTSANCGSSTFSDTLTLISTDISECYQPLTIHVFPNPAKGFVTIEINNSMNPNLKLSIINSLGQTLYSKNINVSHYNEEINLSKFASGVYSIQLLSGEFYSNTKLILNN